MHVSLPGHSESIINYYMAEDAAQNIRADLDASEIPSYVTIQPFGNRLASYSKDVHRLGRKAFRIHYLYEKLYTPISSKNQILKKFLNDGYSQRSSTAAAVHIDYKLASLGISVTDPKISHKSLASYQTKIIETYSRCLKDPDQYGKLLQLEHLRWMFFMIADGYRLPDERDHERYSFKTVNGKFNKAFKCTDEKVKTHHCLVPCDEKGIRLPPNHEEWNKYTSKAAIDASGYDELDRMSLYVHMLAGERIKRPTTIGRIRSLVDYDLQEMLYVVPENSSLRKEVETFREWISQVLRGTPPKGFEAKLLCLQEQFLQNDMDIHDIIQKLTDELTIFVEYYSYKDYKKSDKTIIDHLLWVRFSEDIVMIKTDTKSVLSNIAAPLLLEPQKLIYLGVKSQEPLTEFFENHGNNTTVFYEECSFDSLDTVTDPLSRLVAGCTSQSCIIDVTDAHPLFTAAAVMLASKNKKLGVISCTTNDSSIINIMNYPCAEIYRLNTSLTAGEVFGLYGAQAKSGKENYMQRLGGSMDKLWDFYRKYRTDWEMISTFFSAHASGSSEVHITDFVIPQQAEWMTYRRTLSSDVYFSTGMNEVLDTLAHEGLIRNLTFNETEAHGNLAFEYPDTAAGKFSNNLVFRLDTLLSNLGNIKLKCSITSKSSGTYNIDIASGIYVFASIKSNTYKNNESQKAFEFKNMEHPLRDLEALGLISSLSFSLSNDFGKISFVYSNRAVRDCLTTAGNILEAKVWHEAEKTGYFDSLQANFSFHWQDSSVSNELDVILTKGLTTLVISCKTSKFNKEHLYEIADLSRRFSVNSKPVIIYSSDKAVENGKISEVTDAVRERARKMGIYLIDRDTLDRNLGEELCRIAGDDLNLL